jgi:hypothetical protein
MNAAAQLRARLSRLSRHSFVSTQANEHCARFAKVARHANQQINDGSDATELRQYANNLLIEPV